MKGLMLVGIAIPFLFLLGFLLILGAVISKRSKKTSSGKEPDKKPIYEKKTYMMTRNELYFYRALKKAVGDEYQIMCQVSLYQIIKTRPMSPSDNQKAFNKISRKTLDFVLCDPSNMKTIAAIELDDSSHKRNDRIYRDQFLNQAMKDADVPLIRFPAKSSYTADQVAQKISPLCQLPHEQKSMEQSQQIPDRKYYKNHPIQKQTQPYRV